MPLDDFGMAGARFSCLMLGVRDVIREVIHDRTIWPMIALAMIGKVFDRTEHGLKIRDFAPQRGSVVESNPLDIGTRTVVVSPEGQ